MKIFKLIAVLQLLFIHFSGNSQTNVYHPYPQGWGATWHNEYQFFDGIGISYEYKSKAWNGDTIINSITYTKEYLIEGPLTTYNGGVRQNVALEEAFFIDNQNVEHDISFDQHALIGDTVNINLVQDAYLFINRGLTETLYVVVNIDSVQIQNQYRKQFNLVTANMSGGNSTEATYVCGVGIVACAGFEWGWNVMCFANEYNWDYGNPQNPKCILSNEELPIELTFQLFPNPTSGHIKLNDSPNKVRLVSSDGKEINANTYFLNEDILDISSCACGIYFAHFEFDLGEVVRKIVKQ